MKEVAVVRKCLGDGFITVSSRNMEHVLPPTREVYVTIASLKYWPKHVTTVRKATPLRNHSYKITVTRGTKRVLFIVPGEYVWARITSDKVPPMPRTPYILEVRKLTASASYPNHYLLSVSKRHLTQLVQPVREKWTGDFLVELYTVEGAVAYRGTPQLLNSGFFKIPKREVKVRGYVFAKITPAVRGHRMSNQ